MLLKLLSSVEDRLKDSVDFAKKSKVGESG